MSMQVILELVGRVRCPAGPVTVAGSRLLAEHADRLASNIDAEA